MACNTAVNDNDNDNNNNNKNNNNNNNEPIMQTNIEFIYSREDRSYSQLDQCSVDFNTDYLEDPYYLELNKLERQFGGEDAVLDSDAEDGGDTASEEFDLTAPPPECWHHGKLNRSLAETCLAEVQTPGAFLIRQSDHRSDIFSISFLASHGIIHFRITIYDGFYFIGGRRFSSLSDIVGYYMKYSTVAADESLKIPVPPKQQAYTQYRVMALADYNESHDAEELSFKRGDVFIVLSDIHEIWYWAKSNSTDETGMVPKEICMDVTNITDIYSGKPWFHEQISREQSQQLVVQETKVGAFLVRKSEEQNNYVLIVKNRTNAIKVKISKQGQYYFLGMRPYNSIDDIIKHYKKEQIHENIYLTDPIKKLTNIPLKGHLLTPAEVEKKKESMKAKSKKMLQNEQKYVIKNGYLDMKEKYSLSAKWKRYFVQFRNDQKVVFKEHKNTTKAKYLFNLISCYIIQVDSSLFIKEHTFLLVDYSLSVMKLIYISCPNENEFAMWFTEIKTGINIASGKPPICTNYQVLRNLYVSIYSLKVLQSGFASFSSGSAFCYLCLYGCPIARTSLEKPNTDKFYFWDKEFTFSDLSFDLKCLSIKVNCKTNILQRTAYVWHIGECCIYFRDLINNVNNDFKCELHSKTGLNGNIRLQIRFQNEIILPLKEYEYFQASLLDKSLNALVIFSDFSPERKAICNALIRILSYHHNLHIFIPLILENEILLCDDISKGTLFRGSSLGTTLMDHLMRQLCHYYCQAVIGEEIQSILNESASMEIDPLRVSVDSIEKNLSILLFHIRTLWDKIYNSSNLLPSILRLILHNLKQHVIKKWADDKLFGQRIVSCFLFLRFICPAILSPKFYHLVEDVPVVTPRSLILVTKTLQNLANFSIYPKEPYLLPLRHFLQDKQKEMREFLDIISSPLANPSYINSIVRDPAIDLALLHHKVQAIRSNLFDSGSKQAASLVKASDLLITREKQYLTTEC